MEPLPILHLRAPVTHLRLISRPGKGFEAYVADIVSSPDLKVYAVPTLHSLGFTMDPMPEMIRAEESYGSAMINPRAFVLAELTVEDRTEVGLVSMPLRVVFGEMLNAFLHQEVTVGVADTVLESLRGQISAHTLPEALRHTFAGDMTYCIMKSGKGLDTRIRVMHEAPAPVETRSVHSREYVEPEEIDLRAFLPRMSMPQYFALCGILKHLPPAPVIDQIVMAYACKSWEYVRKA